MNGKETKSPRKKRRGKSLLTKLIFPMIALSMLQVIIIGLALWLNGEFSAIKKFCFDSVSEKTENRRSYVENVLNTKTSLVYETAVAVNNLTESILSEENLTADAVSQNKELNKRILSGSAESLISLIRRDMVNDAFIILNSGDLYSDNGKNLVTGLYLRDTDAEENSVTGNDDIYMEAGSSEVARSLGLPLDFDWSLYIDMSDRESCDFFYETIMGYTYNPETPLYLLGRWSGFTGSNQTMQQSMKYTLPLVAGDGTVYGVIGVGLLEKTIMQSIPAKDFTDESACYVLAADFDSNGVYEPILSSGSAYVRLVDEKTVFSRDLPQKYGLYDFTSNRIECMGSIQDMTLYNSGSPFRSQRWALISVADTEKTLNIYDTLIELFLISVCVTLFAGVLFAFLSAKSISRPVTEMMGALEESRRDNVVVRFGPTGITEIDNLADSITELQVDALEYASRVSRIITMAGSEIGVFMFDCRTGSVFVGESLIKLLEFTSLPEKDVTITESEFRAQISAIDKENRLLGLDEFTSDDMASSEEKSIEILRKYDDGSHRWLKFNIRRDGMNVVGIVQDITNTVTEKLNIAKVKDDEYTAKLLEANAALRDAYALAKQASSAKTDFLSRMSHDIRTPMNAIIGMTAIAEAHIDNEKKLRDCLGKIDVSSRYLLSLINEVLDMSKIESGKFVLNEDKLLITDVINSVVEIIRPAAKEKGHEFNVSVGEIKHNAVIGDGVRIQQAFVNILSNAVKYTPEGGHIEFVAAEKPFRQKKVGCYEFSFRDNGMGMTEEFLEKIYDPFERASDVRVNKESGTGLGMAITKNIIEMMDGDIKVSSELGKGTDFTVTIFLKLCDDVPEEAPEQKKENTSANALHRISQSDFSGNRVLLVDDNELNREIACEILGMTGLTVDSAVDGTDAVDKFSASDIGAYDMIFMDIQMPVMNGYDATRAIRALEREDAGTVPIVAMTANAFAEDVEAARDAGMNEHLAKPLDMNKLLETLNQWLSKDNNDNK